MIRAFICGWEFIPERMCVTNPFVELGVPCSMIYPDADADGLPDGPHVLVFVKADGVDTDALNALDGVYMFPPHPFDMPMSEVSQAVKDEVLGLCVANNWMPAEPLFTAQTYGDCLKLLAAHFQSGFVGFGVYEVERAAEFG